MESKKLNMIERPYIMGQSNYAPYRPLMYFYPLYKFSELVLDIQYVLRDYRIQVPPPASKPRLVHNFQELENFLLRYFPKEAIREKLAYYVSPGISIKINALRYFYVIFDIYNRNKKFNKEKSKSYKIMYTLDLALWHSLATFVFPVYSANISFAIFRSFSLIPKNRSFNWNCFSVLIAVYAFVYLIKIGDFTADFIMNNSFRRFAYDYRNKENNLFTVEYDKLKELDRTRF